MLPKEAAMLVLFRNLDFKLIHITFLLLDDALEKHFESSPYQEALLRRKSYNYSRLICLKAIQA